jgi:hypothetical protein
MFAAALKSIGRHASDRNDRGGWVGVAITGDELRASNQILRVEGLTVQYAR